MVIHFECFSYSYKVGCHFETESINLHRKKMKKLITITFLTLTTFLFAQNRNDELVNYGRLNLGLHGLDLSYELSITEKFVWENSLGVGMGSNVYGSSVEYIFDLIRPTPYLKSELKYIYNFKKRLSKGKSILHNSGNYIGLQTKYSFGNSNESLLNQTMLTEIHWGIQRPLGKKIIFGIHIGLGYIKDFDTKDEDISPTFGLRFGYKLF